MPFRSRAPKPKPKPRSESQSLEVRGLPRRFTEERERADLAVTVLEDRAGVGRGTVSRLEDGSRVPTAENLFRLARELNVNLHWLITGEGPRQGIYSAPQVRKTSKA
jgi:transcriptional regulator with XRE-family HTH domain